MLSRNTTTKPRANQKRKLNVQLTLDLLENRLVPANNVGAAARAAVVQKAAAGPIVLQNGILKLTGDNE